MSIRKILVPLKGGAQDKVVLGAAARVTKQLGGQLTGLFVRPDPTEALPYMGDGVSGQVIEQLLDAAKEGADAASARASAHLHEAAKEAGLEVVKAGGPLPSARFYDVTGRQDVVISEESRLADLVVFAEGEPDGDQFGGDALEAAVMNAGRPVLIAPQDGFAGKLGGTVVIGWDGSVQASHAVSAALAFLQAAEKIVILCIGEDEIEPERGARLKDYLGLHDVKAELRLVDRKDRSTGQALLEEAGALDAGLLVMGAYSHSRLRELLIGGVTRHVRGHASIPVLMAH
jgi:nucleotide-binding universal stress UspA family protein